MAHRCLVQMTKADQRRVLHERYLDGRDSDRVRQVLTVEGLLVVVDELRRQRDDLLKLTREQARRLRATAPLQ